MLTHLELRDLVIVDRAELDFAPGLNALTGETGAGKSIVVDALLLVAGGRAGADIVRQDAPRAEIAASFAALPEAATAWLASQDIEHDDEIILRRVIGADGRSRAYINGQLVPLQQLREFAEFVIEIHGQQEFQRLVQRASQREMLDGHVDPVLVGELAEVYRRFRECRREYDSLQAANSHRDSRIELLRHQISELEAEVTSRIAIEELFVERKRNSSRARLTSAAQSALTAIYEADAGSAHDMLAKAQASLRAAGDADAALLQPAALLAEASILTRDAADTLRHYLDGLDVDPARQEEIERRAAALEALARKHRQPVLELPAELARCQLELESLDEAEVNLQALEHRLARLCTEYRHAADRLTRERSRAAEQLGTDISSLMQTLGMSGGQFAVNVEPSGAEFSPHGLDEIEFLVSANPGQPLKSVAKVASGGELSRISLAVQVAAAASATSCMVFDEVDAGIGGAVAEIVGRQLHRLGERSQVLCVTHLAQVAAQAHRQFNVAKTSDGRVTRTTVRALDATARVEEIARMLGGIAITQQARAHAQEMIAGAAAALTEATEPVLAAKAPSPATTEPSRAAASLSAPTKKKRARGR